jgi:hypothetical protein
VYKYIYLAIQHVILSWFGVHKHDSQLSLSPSSKSILCTVFPKSDRSKPMESFVVCADSKYRKGGFMKYTGLKDRALASNVPPCHFSPKLYTCPTMRFHYRNESHVSTTTITLRHSTSILNKGMLKRHVCRLACFSICFSRLKQHKNPWTICSSCFLTVSNSAEMESLSCVSKTHLASPMVSCNPSRAMIFHSWQKRKLPWHEGVIFESKTGNLWSVSTLIVGIKRLPRVRMLNITHHISSQTSDSPPRTDTLAER